MKVGVVDVTDEDIDAEGDDGTPEQTDKDVARIMDSEIEARPTVDERIADKAELQPAVTHEQTEIEGDAEGVGRMG